MEVFWISFWGYSWEPFRIPNMERQDAAKRRQDAAKRLQNAGRMRKNLEPARSTPSPCIDFLQKSGRISCRKRLETPLAAGLAAGAGGFRPL